MHFPENRDEPFFAHHGFTLLAQQTVSLRGADLINFRMNKALKS